MAIKTLLAIIYNMPVSRTGKYRTEILIGSDDHSGSENSAPNGSIIMHHTLIYVAQCTVKNSWCRFVSLNHNIYIAVDPTPVYVDYDAHTWIPTIFSQRIMSTYLL